MADLAHTWLCELEGGVGTFMISFTGISQGVGAGIHYAQLKVLSSLD